MRRADAWLRDRLDGAWRVPQAVATPDDEGRARAAVWLATGVTLGLYLLATLLEARDLTPAFVRTLLTQIGVGPVPSLFRQTMVEAPPISVEMEYTLGAPSLVALFLPALLFPSPDAIGAGILLKMLCLTLNLGGSPLLFAVARRLGARPWQATTLALLYLWNPLLTWKLSWDVVGYQGTPLIAAWLLLARGRRGLAVFAWAIAATAHPVAVWGVAWWALAEWRSARWQGGPSRLLGIAALGLLAYGGMVLLLVSWMPAISSGTGVAMLRAQIASHMSVSALPLHGLLLLALFGAWSFLPFLRGRWIWLVLPDLLYYAGSGVSHGLLPATTGVLALAAAEGWAMGTRRPGRGTWVLGALVRPWRGGLLLALILTCHLVPDPNVTLLRRLVLPPAWDGAWIADSRALTHQVPADATLCLTASNMYPLFQGHCPRTLPWSWPETGQPVDPGRERYVIAVNAALLDTDRYPQHTTLGESDGERAREVAARLEAGDLVPIAVAGQACLLAPRAQDGPPAEAPCPFAPAWRTHQDLRESPPAAR